MNIERLRKLIQETHVHGVQLGNEIRTLQQRHPPGARAKAIVLRVRLRGLEVLNARRRREVAKLEHKPVPPAPKPQPHLPVRFEMYDTTEVNTGLPTTAPVAVAGYTSGNWPTYNGLVAKYPHAKHLSIAVNARHDAQCLDVETGDATPADAPGWVRRQHARGIKRPILYANTSTMPAVLDALNNDFIKRGEYLVWTAHYTGTPHIEPGSDATHWESVENPGHNYDISLCEGW